MYSFKIHLLNMVGETVPASRSLLDAKEEENFTRIARNILNYNETRAQRITEYKFLKYDEEEKRFKKCIALEKVTLFLTENNIFMRYIEYYAATDEQHQFTEAGTATIINGAAMQLDDIIVDVYSLTSMRAFDEFRKKYQDIITK